MPTRGEFRMILNALDFGWNVADSTSGLFQTGWTVSVDLVISSESGIGYLTDKNGSLNHVGSFIQVQNIQTIVQEGQKPLLQLRIAGTADVLSISCDSLRTAEGIADLIDGYCRLVHSTQASYWTRKGDSR